MKLDLMIGTISQIWRFGDTSDGIMSMTTLCEKILWIVDICTFCQINSFVTFEISK